MLRSAEMISFKDIPMLLGMAGTLLTGGFYVHDIKRDVIQLSEAFIGDQMLHNQKEIWIYQDRVKKNPKDEESQDRLRTLEYEKKLLEYKQQKLKGG